MTFVYKQKQFMFVVVLCLSVNILLFKEIKRPSGNSNRFAVPGFQKKTAELHRRLFSWVECHQIKWQRLRTFYSLILFCPFKSKRLILSFAGDAFPGASSPFLGVYVSTSSAHGSSDPAFRTPNPASLQMAQLWASHPHEGKKRNLSMCPARNGEAAWMYWV